MKEHGKEALQEEIRKISGIKVHYVRQPYMRGLGDAILCAREFVDGEPFGVILGDDIVYTRNREPALKQLMNRYYETGSTVVGCEMVPEEKVSAYGIIQGERTENPNLLKVWI